MAFQVLKEITAIRPDWNVPHKSENGSGLSEEQLDKLIPLEKIKLVATQGDNDEKELYDLCGTKEYRQKLDKQFKNNDSNFRIAIVVDMWITGFDVPSLAVMYIDKPLHKHTLIQTISRVNRVFEGKDKGLVVDYIGIKQDMLEAVKKYGGPHVNSDKPEDLFGDEFLKQLDKVNLPITKLNALLKLLRKAVSGYGKFNKVKAIIFNERLKKVIDAYNSRDKLVFTSEVVADFINGLSDELLKIFADLQADKTSFEKFGITYEEKAFYDILVKVRDEHKFKYEHENALFLQRKLKNWSMTSLSLPTGRRVMT